MNQTETPLADAAAAFLADGRVTPFTTPGHKRAPHLADELLRLDLPLSAGADDLHLRWDVLGRAERLAAERWEADLCRFCVNGSTEGNQALALALGRPGDPVVVSRNLHKSVFAGLVLAGLEPVWVRPDVDVTTGLAGRLPPVRVTRALAETPGARGVFLVEPSFVGVLSDVAAIAESCRTAGVPLVVDQAWGAHLGFHPHLPPHALALGADAMVTSAHKTLTAFTQGAYLFARGERLDLARVAEGFDALHTTSPAAAILASLDRTRGLLATRGEELLARPLRLAAAAREALAAVDGLVVVDSDDPTKLALAVAGTGADGLEVEADLFAEGIRLELANRDLLVPLLTVGDTEESVERLVAALLRSFARRRGEPRPPGGASAVWSVEAEVAMSPREAFFAARETVPAEWAAGRIAAETVAPYPPGIPAIAPGELVTAALLDALREAAAHGTRLAYCADATLATLRVVVR
ncbi:MAG TPA: aminotransferase class V-fold PLP-dependent enzyme [Gaiellaceae bacterium]|nr:aminotransferase class V-fold PLP-dependent enzyme [Gaiellaceae bacterium]